MATSPPPSPQELPVLLERLPRWRPDELAERAAALAQPDLDLVVHVAPLLDLTALAATDTVDDVVALAHRARDPGRGLPPVAAVCVHADRVAPVAAELDGSPVRVASVAGAFPHARSPLEVRCAEVAAVVAAGAHEVDVVIDRAALRSGDHVHAAEQLQAMVTAAGDARVKVILESGALDHPDDVAAACWTAMVAGASMVKTSTGKDGPGADPGAVLVMVTEAQRFATLTGRDVGVKISGGVSTPDEATAYLHLVREVAGPGWLHPDRLRFGASRLLDALRDHEEVGS